MGRTILNEIDGFTPVIDAIVDDLGLMPAVVFGRIWRYCQMEDKECSASLERIAGEIGVSRKTVQRYTKELCEAGYLVDTTPNRRNRPHRYKDAGKVQLRSKTTARRLDRESYQKGGRSDRESECLDRESDLGRTESPMKIEEDTNQETPYRSDARANFSVLADICKIDLATITPTQRGKLNQVEKLLRTRKGVTTDDIEAFGKWWYRDWWQGKNGQPPRPMQIRENWGAFERRGGGADDKGRMRIKV